jgi:MFS family permease
MGKRAADISRPANNAARDEPESAYAWIRLGAALLLSAMGGVGMWSVIVARPAVQAEFGIARAAASLPYTATMISFGLGGILMGRVSDRLGIIVPVTSGALSLGADYALASQATGPRAVHPGPGPAGGRRWIGHVRAAHGRHVAVVHPPSRHGGGDHRVRQLPRGNGLAAGRAALHPGRGLAPDVPRDRGVLRGDHAAPRPGPPAAVAAHRDDVRHGASHAVAAPAPRHVALQTILVMAGLCCCVAMSMPQVHIVAYSGDLGHGAAHGAQMLSLMLGAGVVSRLGSGWISDRIGGRCTLLLGSSLQALALALFLPFDGLVSLYVLSGLFGLVQGGIVPSYTLIVREFFPRREAGVRVGAVLMATVFGMALGGWMSGVIFDLTGSYQAAFLNGILWNLLNIAIAVALLRRPGSPVAHASP